MGGAKIGLVELPLALMNPGDLLLLPDPGYPDYLSGVSLGRVAYETFPLTAENDFCQIWMPFLRRPLGVLSLSISIIRIIRRGLLATKAFYEKLVAWAKTYEVGVVSDLAYGALGYQGYENPSFLSTPGAKDVGIEFYTSRNLQYGWLAFGLCSWE